MNDKGEVSGKEILKPVASAGCLAFVALAVMGVLAAAYDDVFAVFELDRERGFAAVVSALLLVAAGVATAASLRKAGPRGLIAFSLPALLVFMSLDELLEIHETLERLSGVDWQVLYAPLMIMGALGWLRVVRTWGPRSRAGALLLAGGVAWGVSQVLEGLQWDGDVPVSGYGFYMVPEEILEAGGSLSFLVAALVVLQSRAARTGDEVAVNAGE